MKVDFHPEAEAELVAAIDYYETCEPGLGLAFALPANCGPLILIVFY